MWHFLIICAVLFGVEFVHAIESAFLQPVLLQLNLPVQYTTMIWAIPPVIGLIVLPYTGSLSDNCKCRFGKRRPFILMYSSGCVIGLLLLAFMPQISKQNNYAQIIASLGVKIANKNESISIQNGESETSSQASGLEIGLTIFCVILLDLCIDSILSPTFSYILEVTETNQQNTAVTFGNTVYGFGGFVGYLFGGFDIKSSFSSIFTDHFRLSFFMAAMVLTITTLFTLLVFGEESSLFQTKFFLKALNMMTKPFPPDTLTSPGRKSFKSRNTTSSLSLVSSSKANKKDKIANFPITINITSCHAAKKSIGVNTKSSGIKNGASQSHKKVVTKLKRCIQSAKQEIYLIFYTPKPFLVLLITTFFCWTSILSYAIYFSDLIGQEVFNGKASVDNTLNSLVLHHIYRNGVRFSSFTMCLFSFVSMLYSLALKRILNKVGVKIPQIFGIGISLLGMVIFSIFPRKETAFILSALMGFIYGNTLSIPIIIISEYHKDSKFVNATKRARGIGKDIALLSSEVFLAQLFLSLFIGFLISSFNTTMVSAYVGAVCMSISFLASFLIKYPKMESIDANAI